MTDAPIRLGTRASLLATTQSGLVADALRAMTGRAVDLVQITTHGDVLTGPLAQLGGTGVFAAALREALLRGECDLVVHSMKDLPTAEVEGLRLGAVPPRASSADVLCSRDGRTLDGLPRGAVVGTGSPRRVAQLLQVRPDLEVRGIRGNVDTRLRKVDDGEYDAIVLAEAGLARIGREERIADRFDPVSWPTSAGQGALAVEVRDGDPFADDVAVLSEPDAARTALLERAVLRRLEAGCAAPVGISAHTEGSITTLIAQVYDLRGERSIRVERAYAPAEVTDDVARAAAAADVVRELLDRGATGLADLPGSGA